MSQNGIVRLMAAAAGVIATAGTLMITAAQGTFHSQGRLITSTQATQRAQAIRSMAMAAVIRRIRIHTLMSALHMAAIIVLTTIIMR
jgi:hypothetical protein